MHIQGRKIFLRKIDPNTDDLGAYLGWLRDTSTNKFIVSAKPDYSMETLVSYVNQKNSAVNILFLGIFTVDVKRLIGTIKLEPIDFTDKFAWLGMLIGGKTDQGKGYGSESLDLVLDYAKYKLGLNQIFLGVDPDNEVARRLYMKHGFEFQSLKLNTMVKNLNTDLNSIVWSE